jgi:hypothetical protein
MHEVHSIVEVQAEQFVGQIKQEPLDKYLPVLHDKHDSFVDELQDKQL